MISFEYLNSSNYYLSTINVHSLKYKYNTYIIVHNYSYLKQLLHSAFFKIFTGKKRIDIWGGVLPIPSIIVTYFFYILV